MGSKKAKKDSKAKAAVRTSPRKQKASRDADPDEDSQEQSQEPSDEPERREALLESDEAKEPEGDGEKPDKVGTVWTPEQDEQIAGFFEENTLFYDMTNAEYKNKKKRDNLLLELSRSMFDSGKLEISFQFILPRPCFVEQCCLFSPSVQNVLRNIDHNNIWCKLVY